MDDSAGRAVVVVAAGGSEEAGRLATALAGAGLRVAVFESGGSTEALLELVDELYGPRP